MNPTVVAAAISVSGVVVVGVAGFGAAIWNTRKTMAQARESRVWDQRARVYTDAIAALHYRQTAREYRTGVNLPTEQAKRDAHHYLETYQPPSWIELEARLLAFASEPVVTAVQVASTAHLRVMQAYQSRAMAEATPGTSAEARAEAAAARPGRLAGGGKGRWCCR
jgi:hypothetical protein